MKNENDKQAAQPALPAEPSDQEIYATLGQHGALPPKDGSPECIIKGRELVLIQAIRAILSKIYAANRLRDVRGLALECIKSIDAAPGAAQTQPISDVVQVRQLPELNEDLRDILGRPNFTCGALASLLRTAGQDIAYKAEDEQAAVIYFLLGFYLQHGQKWIEAVDAEIKRLAATHPTDKGQSSHE
jgi:hypothetical protein